MPDGRPPHFEDNGEPGTWVDAILHSPFLKVSDYAPCDLPETDRAAQSLDTAPRRVTPFPLGPARVSFAHSDGDTDV
jgi:hypothetical protein